MAFQSRPFMSLPFLSQERGRVEIIIKTDKLITMTDKDIIPAIYGGLFSIDNKKTLKRALFFDVAC